MGQSFSIDVNYGRLAVNTPDRATLLVEVERRLIERTGFALATVNLDHLVKLRRDPSFCNAYARHDLVVADGNPIVWLSRIAGRPVSLVPGADLVKPLAALAARCGAPIGLVGSTENALSGAAAQLYAEASTLSIAARIAPSNGFDPDGKEADEVIETLRQSGARLVFLALGAPRQEQFAARCRRELPTLGLASIGAGLDFLSGDQRRAPAWIRYIAMEWLWRAASQPRRLAGRYARCALLFPRLALDAARQRFPAPPSGLGGDYEAADSTTS